MHLRRVLPVNKASLPHQDGISASSRFQQRNQLLGFPSFSPILSWTTAAGPRAPTSKHFDRRRSAATTTRQTIGGAAISGSTHDCAPTRVGTPASQACSTSGAGRMSAMCPAHGDQNDEEFRSPVPGPSSDALGLVQNASFCGKQRNSGPSGTASAPFLWLGVFTPTIRHLA